MRFRIYIPFYSLIFIFLMSLKAQAQTEKKIIGVGASFGATNYMGELDANLSLQFVRPGYGVYAVYPLAPFLDLRANLFYGRIYADDALASNSENYRRNLNFRSDISEFGVHAVLKYPSKSGSAKNYFSHITPYLFGGVAVFHFNPQANYNGRWVDLQPLGTEGQNLSGNYPEPYSLTQLAIPLGGGLDYKLADNLSFGFEIGLRKTFTDYLDDVSGYYPDKELLRQQSGQIAFELSDRSDKTNHPDGKESFSRRGSPGTKDWYIYSNLHFTYYFTPRHFFMTQNKKKTGNYLAFKK